MEAAGVERTETVGATQISDDFRTAEVTKPSVTSRNSLISGLPEATENQLASSLRAGDFEHTPAMSGRTIMIEALSRALVAAFAERDLEAARIAHATLGHLLGEPRRGDG